MSDLESKFQQAQVDVKTLTSNPGNEMLLKNSTPTSNKQRLVTCKVNGPE